MRRAALALALASLLSASSASAQRVVRLSMVPTDRAQIAVWIEDADGNYLATLGLTSAVALRGIGNRPGASMMNSGFRWPYGRREGVLPVWAHARASAPGAALFRRVIFQDRISEGHASRSSDDSTRDDYYCLSFNVETTGRDALDAVSCASVFMSDKGRYITEADVARPYIEPQERDGSYVRAPLDLYSLYPPRRDAVPCGASGCADHPDLANFRRDADRVMPELDAVTMATPRGGVPLEIMYTVPDTWADGTYRVFVEVNVEGDWNDNWGPSRFPTPGNPSMLEPGEPQPWDYWALSYGYAYRGQPSVVYQADVEIAGGTDEATVSMPVGYGSISGTGAAGGDITPLDASMTNDPSRAPGSGVDRLHGGTGGVRLTVASMGPAMCEENTPPAAPGNAAITPWAEQRDAHRFAVLGFDAPADDAGIRSYEVRVSRDPITDLASFLSGVPANEASIESIALRVPTTARPGERVEVDMGGMAHETHYFIGIRALDACNASSEITVVEYTTPAITFTTVSPCFVATATYGDPMAEEIGALRRFRDRYLMSNAVGRAVVATYYEVGPHLAAFIAADEDRRAIARTALAPVVWLADRL